MSKLNQNYHNYICLVDNYRRPSRQRNTKGRYRVGAKNPKQARKLLQQAIGFGSVQVYYEAKDILIGYKEIVKEVYQKDHKQNLGFIFKPIHHATAPITTKEV